MTTAIVLISATFLPKAAAADSSSRIAVRLRPKLERTSAPLIATTMISTISARTKNSAGL